MGKLGVVIIVINMVGCGIDIKLGGNVEFKIMEVIVVDFEVNFDEIRVWIEEGY